MSQVENISFIHISVLSRELIAGLNIIPEGHYLDATVGGGGHSELILSAAENVKVTAIDRDQNAIAATQVRLSQYYPQQLQFWQGNFAHYQPKKILFDGIVADLGVSSPQLDVAERGFSFRQTAPLDMRMDQNQALTAAEIINHWDEVKLANIFYQYGEERLSRRIAKRIVQQRPFNNTIELANAIASSVPPKYRYGRINPATRVFQALRIVVNQELQSLETFLSIAPHWLKPTGIIAIITFHSLEDRIVKHQFRNNELLEVITKKPIIPQSNEQQQNPRSRSAKLRLARRIISSS
ncbi:Ribosomal RNA small subunit methyltransferase H [Stanieria cyanosphaera PCC 7437]|uniref:Ribosomal RNA small subunit methyltransferase H n=1 Tax=Stanieria cyanosphaera (strain ATCC 29371 / PCC 7437) TaxID=111780 RepID=K9XST0_STAC7|nr:16S rRNA (cytosine(1402)-N(4))-methyltransferase RsmH [Stanieria cyanosphaera]AFZ35131.1 Ribosomal RNA small subunit methyltransferase H [Stanieria cyanosphaera PCC 7437]